MKVSMFAVQKSSLPKGVGLLSCTLRRTGDPPETWVPNLNREPCRQYMQSTENHCLKSLKRCLKVETNLAALEWLSGEARPTLWSIILVYFISLFFSLVFQQSQTFQGNHMQCCAPHKPAHTPHPEVQMPFAGWEGLNLALPLLIFGLHFSWSRERAREKWAVDDENCHHVPVSISTESDEAALGEILRLQAQSSDCWQTWAALCADYFLIVLAETNVLMF